MHLKSFTLNNFRKFKKEDSKILLAYEKFREKDMEKEVNISTTSTLIIGKNNAGKTSIIGALKKLEGNHDSFKAADFNFEYLQDLLKIYKEKGVEGKENLPRMSFKMEIELDDKDDIVSNIAPLLFLDNRESATLQINVEIGEEEEFKEKVRELLLKKDEEQHFKLLLDALDDVDLKTIYLNKDGDEIRNFHLKDLIEIKSIEANTITHQNSLTEAFNKIIKFRYRRDREAQASSLSIDESIDNINQQLTCKFRADHGADVNNSLGKIEHANNLKIKLTSDLTHSKLLENKILIYEYMDNGLTIPEDQYGLGYTNLVMIIAEIMDYIERAPEEAFSSKINLISIEEPETYMHPQMQELFIKNINDAIEQLLESHEKYVNSQIIITTHSSHILNSKIHSGNSFNFINYCTTLKNRNEIVNLQDNTIVDGEVNIFKKADSAEGEADSTGINKELSKDEIDKRAKDYLNFIKKHIKYKVSELFFSDAIIFVEGITEEILIKYWLEQCEFLRHHYICVFNINGSHGLVYHHLINQLKVPALIITDLDIQENKVEKEKAKDGKFKNIASLEKRTTTNQTLIHYFGENLEKLSEKSNQISDNLYITYQIEESGYFPTSFEEALILKHYNNDILQSALQSAKPQIFKKTHDGNDENLKDNSRYLQKKLDGSKTEFANTLLFELETEEKSKSKFEAPNYINNGLIYLRKKLKR